MREGFSPPEARERGPEDRTTEALDACDRAMAKVKPDTRPARLIAALAFATGLLAGGEAHAEPTALFEAHANKIEQHVRRYEALLEHHTAQGATGYVRSLNELQQLRAEWLKERQADLHYVDLSPDEAELAAYGIALGNNSVEHPANRVVEGYWQQESQFWAATPPHEVTKDLHNEVVFKNGHVAFDIGTFKVNLEKVSPSEIHLLGFEIDGTVDDYKIVNGELVDKMHYNDDAALPYPEYQAQAQKEQKKANWGLPKSGHAPF